jgi:Protein of unknown function (DUF3048) N-terminal domain/Protein of unknown function (DUF3048) C-terminal domain
MFHRRRHGRWLGGIVVASLVVAACGSKLGSKPIAALHIASASSTSTSTTVVTGPPYPLTGLPMADPSIALHPAVVVKMDNSPWARPQAGINQADIVYELLVEGITRYALVFGSDLPTTVGPVRSARSSDIDLLAGLGRPLLAWSGGNPTVTLQVGAAAHQGLLVDAGRGANPPQYWRDNSREAPHNLFANVPLLLSKFGGGSTTPPQAMLPMGAAGLPLPATATLATGVTINFGSGVVADYTWNGPHKGWDRTQIDSQHDLAHSATLDPSGVQVSPPNVVVLFVPYKTSIADSKSPQALTVGQGTGFVLTEGHQVPITWSRAANTSAFVFASGGAPFALPPGRTWVALPEVGSQVTVR